MTVTVNFTGLEPVAEALNNLARSIGAAGFVTTVQTAGEMPVEKVAQVQLSAPAKEPQAETVHDNGQADPEVTYTLENVREKLATLNKAGKRNEVKTLLLSFGSEKLSGIDPEHFADLMKKAEEL